MGCPRKAEPPPIPGGLQDHRTLFAGKITADSLLYAFVEAVLIVLIVWHAWRWPKEERADVTP